MPCVLFLLRCSQKVRSIMLTSRFRKKLVYESKTYHQPFKGYIIFVIALALILVGCGSGTNLSSQSNQNSPQLNPAILGRWTGQCAFPNVSSSFKQAEFLSDGTVILDGESGKFSPLDAQRINIQYGAAGVVFTYSVSGNTLMLTDYSGTSCTLNRISSS